MSPKQQRGAETAQRLLDAALAVHEEGGSEQFTVQAISAASGVSLGSLYHHFGSADGLAAALYARCMVALLEAVAAPLTTARTARAGVRGIAAAYLTFVAEQPAAARFIHASAVSGYLAAHAETVAAAKKPAIEPIFEWARPHVRAGRIVDLPEPLLEMLIIGPVAETARRYLAGVPGLDLAEAVRVLPERIWQAVRAPAEG
ncbi:TetR/AcrR family transcriptional regulator [Cryptosporangium aurantiacum]|uniref:Transcriptional regulator, TetR family n=1 Tax=Cryptosporangium aurantiacum TaxID=134849 RepID=A0A1M7QRC5_9ACTN|nr:TetR/AcrR family transcriptional regulator [Cryptosporangium aurantiacum]SHN33884.1 transcriptional regulator, TetR family [Cryptosporangium aurantiacum]